MVRRESRKSNHRSVLGPPPAATCDYEVLAKLPTCAVENQLDLGQLKSLLTRAEITSGTCCELVRLQQCLRQKVGGLLQCQDRLEQDIQAEVSHPDCQPSIFCGRWYEWPLIIYIVFALLFLIALILLVLFCVRKCQQRKH